MNFEEGAKTPPIKTSADKFAGHVVVITGAAQGIGKRTAQVFAAQGALVVLSDVLEGTLDRVQPSTKTRGGKSSCKLCDIGTKFGSMRPWGIVPPYGNLDVVRQLGKSLSHQSLGRLPH